MRRHDLLRLDPPAWQAMLHANPHLEGLPLVSDWASQGWPVIVRRRMAGEPAGGIAAALPLPPCHGKRRVGFVLPPAAVRGLPPVPLRAAAPGAPASWQPTIAALLALGDANGTPPRVFGALLWQHLTRLPYLSPHSDLDLLWTVDSAAMAARLAAGLRQLEQAGPVRLDGEFELPDGGGVNWREWPQAGEEVLVKSLDSVALRRTGALFATALA